MYITSVLPTGKLSFGERVLDTKFTVPELSVAVGGVHETGTKLEFNGTIRTISSGQLTTTGGSVSSSDWRKTEHELVATVLGYGT